MKRIISSVYARLASAGIFKEKKNKLLSNNNSLMLESASFLLLENVNKIIFEG